MVGTRALKGFVAAFLLPRDLYQLRQAALSFTGVDPRHLRSPGELAQAAPSFIGTITRNLHNPSLLAPALPVITRMLCHCEERWQQTLRRLLSLFVVDGDKASVVAVIVALPAMRALTSLNLASNALGPNGATHIAKAVKGHVSAVLFD